MTLQSYRDKRYKEQIQKPKEKVSFLKRACILEALVAANYRIRVEIFRNRLLDCKLSPVSNGFWSSWPEFDCTEHFRFLLFWLSLLI